MNANMKIIEGWFKLAVVVCAISVVMTAVASGDSRRDKTGTRPDMEKAEAPQVPVIKDLARPRCLRTERAGFEPAERFDTFTGLANRRFQPLSHLSRCPARRTKATLQ